jgi:hypothetical protein
MPAGDTVGRGGAEGSITNLFGFVANYHGKFPIGCFVCNQREHFVVATGQKVLAVCDVHIADIDVRGALVERVPEPL